MWACFNAEARWGYIERVKGKKNKNLKQSHTRRAFVSQVRQTFSTHTHTRAGITGNLRCAPKQLPATHRINYSAYLSMQFDGPPLRSSEQIAEADNIAPRRRGSNHCACGPKRPSTTGCKQSLDTRHFPCIFSLLICGAKWKLGAHAHLCSGGGGGGVLALLLETCGAFSEQI